MREPHSFSRLINPRAIAVVGASHDLSRIGGQPLRLLTEFGYRGQVYPVNPKHKEIKGLRCYPNVASVPRPCDVALIALSGAHVTPVVEQCGAAGIPFAVVISSGFSEAGAEGKALQENLLAAVRTAGVRLVGPNCLGVLNVKENIRNGFGGVMRHTFVPGPYAMVTQSGGFGFSVLTTAAYYGVGVNYAISTGNEADVSTLDLTEYFIERDDVQGVFVFMEGVKDGRRLIGLGKRALELGKPIFVWKVGNSDVGRQAAVSHSSRMIAGYELFQAAFRHGGFIEVRETAELLDALKIFRIHRGRMPRSNRTGIVSVSGGAGVLLADRCVEHGLELPPLATTTKDELRTFMAPFASIANPIDATGAGNNDSYASYNRLVSTVLNDPNIDQLIVRIPSSSGTVLAQGLIDVARGSDKPVMVDWPISPGENPVLMQLLEDNGLPCMPSPGRGARALAALNDFARRKRAYDAQLAQPAPRAIAPQALELPKAAATLSERCSKQLLQAYGIPVVAEVLLSGDVIAALEMPPLPFPLAAKIESPQIAHKTEAGAVRLDIRSLDELKTAARDITAAARKFDPNARIEGISVQEMARGLEVIVGAINDPIFGPVVLFGLGGIHTELLKDITHGFAPFDASYAKQMIDGIKGSALLHGFRGSPPLDVEALADTLSRLSLLLADHAERIAEIDINPLFVRTSGQGAVAADALIVLK